MTEPRECIRGCLRADGTARPAADGTALCRPDLLRLAEWLGDWDAEGSLWWLEDWLDRCYDDWPFRAVEVLTAITKGDPPAPSSAAILDAQYVLTRQVKLSVRMLCELHGLHGPDRWVLPSLLPWLRAHEHDLASAPFAGHLWDGFARLMSQAHALAPWRPRPTRHAGICCPECLAVGSLVTQPPKVAQNDAHGRSGAHPVATPTATGGDTSWCEACGYVLTRDQLERWVPMMAAHYKPRGHAWADPSGWDQAARAHTPRPAGPDYPPGQNTAGGAA